MKNTNAPSDGVFDDLGDQTYMLRWSGRQEGPYPAGVIRQKLVSNEIGLLHEIFYNGHWLTIRDLKNAFEAKRRFAAQTPPPYTAPPPQSAPASVPGIPPGGTRASSAEPQPVLQPADASAAADPEDSVGDFNLGEFFSQVFKSHKAGVMQDIFCVGGSRTTPSLAEIPVRWPQPWIFARICALSIGVFILFVYLWSSDSNPRILPGLLMVGSFAIPISVLVLFFEVNLWRNLTCYDVLRLFTWGAIVSFVFTTYLNDMVNELAAQHPDIKTMFGSSIAGPIEETAKLLTACVIARRLRCTKILNGLLIGGAVGAGFAAFESAGYGFECFIKSGFDSIDDTSTLIDFCQGGLDGTRNHPGMFGIILLRGMLAPFGHVAWTAMTAAAWWKVKGDKRFDILMLVNPQFLAIFILAAGLHWIWDSTFFAETHLIAKYILIGLAGWAVVMSLIRAGLLQIADEKKAAGLQP